MGSKTQNSPQSWHYAPSRKVRPRTVVTTWGGVGGNYGGGSGGGRTTGRGPVNSPRGATKEGGAREETGGTRSRRRTAGPRPQPWWWPTVEPTEGGAMEEGWPLTPGGRPTAAEQVVEEPEAETESQRARGMQRIRGARVEQRALANKAEAEIRGWATEDPGGADGRKEPNGAGGTEQRGAARGEESRGDGGSTPDQGGAGGKREPGGSTGDGGGEGARSRGGAAGSTGRSRVQASEAGGIGEGYSSPSNTGGWQNHGARTIQIRGRGRAGGGCQMTAVEEAGIFEERALEGTFEERVLEVREPPLGWTWGPETKEGWTGPAGMTERGEGAIRIPAQSPSQWNPPPCPAVPDV